MTKYIWLALGVVAGFLIYKNIVSDQEVPLLQPKAKPVETLEKVGEFIDQPEEPKPTDLTDTAQSSEKVLEISLSKNDIRENRDDSKSAFSKSYKLLAEVELTKAEQEVRLKLDEPIENVISLVFVGGHGEVKHQVSKVSVNGKTNRPEFNSLEGVYFEDDWQKLDLKGNNFRSMSFKGSALQEEGKLKVYIQYQK